MSEWRKGINDRAAASLEPHSQILELKRLVRDLIALSALAAMWKDYEPSRIAHGAASALASMIGANFVLRGSALSASGSGCSTMTSRCNSSKRNALLTSGAEPKASAAFLGRIGTD